MDKEMDIEYLEWKQRERLKSIPVMRGRVSEFLKGLKQPFPKEAIQEEANKEFPIWNEWRENNYKKVIVSFSDTKMVISAGMDVLYSCEYAERENGEIQVFGDSFASREEAALYYRLLWSCDDIREMRYRKLPEWAKERFENEMKEEK